MEMLWPPTILTLWENVGYPIEAMMKQFHLAQKAAYPKCIQKRK
jgi:hypothetical protein